jgi:membrane-bound metal-dependent hydrolase YbcI (DUF457 family)
VCSPVGHSLVGVAAYLLAAERPLPGPGWRLAGAGTCVVLANLPDADFLVPVLFGQSVGHAFHRGLSHSVAFALGVGVLAALLAAAAPRLMPSLAGALPGWRRAGLGAGLLVASHLVLDVFGADTRPPYGVPLLAPFSDAHFISPVPLFASVDHRSLATLVAPANLLNMAADLWLALPLGALLLLRYRRGRG